MGQALGLVLEGSRAEGRASGGGDGVGRGERGGGGVRASREPWGVGREAEHMECDPTQSPEGPPQSSVLVLLTRHRWPQGPPTRGWFQLEERCRPLGFGSNPSFTTQW